GFLTQKEAKKLARQAERETEDSTKKARPMGGAVMTQALENYIDLHRHAIVRLALIANPNVAFRLAVAHMAAASGNWSVKPDPQTTRNTAIRASIENSAAQVAFADEERAVRLLLGWNAEGDEDVFIRRQTCDVFATLLALTDDEVSRIAAFLMARSLTCGSDVVEDVGARLAVDARRQWQADDTFFDLIPPSMLC
ncbi:MAG: chromosome partitioning protein ParB, partial [Terriglobia bacterium]|nr:chromosome partitioning protein ParB [Terriglobia bacterium]